MEEIATAHRHEAQGARIRAALTAAGLTEVDVVALMGTVSRTSVSRWVTGETAPTYRRRHDLVAALGVPYHRIFIPEETADLLSRGARRILLTAHHLRGGGEHFYIVSSAYDRLDTDWLARYWLVEDNGVDRERKRRLWHLTGPGEDVLDIIRGEAGVMDA